MKAAKPGIWAVVPIKELRLAKQRLAGAVPPELRASLARAMAMDTLEALAHVTGLQGVMVVTADVQAARLAAGMGAIICGEDAQDGHTFAVAAAALRLEREGCAAMLALPADIPTVTAGEIEALLTTEPTMPGVTLVPSRDGDGTNAILASPSTALALAFGPGSFARHVRAARAAGLEPRIVRSAGIGLDIDTAEDLRLLAASAADTRSRRLCRSLPPAIGIAWEAAS